MPPGGTRGAALQQAGQPARVDGQRSGHNIYLLDGVKVTDEYFNNLVVSPSIDAIQEFKIQKTMYPAEFGGKASALINVVTKSGSNAFHGGGARVLPQRRARCAQLLRRSDQRRCRRFASTSSARASADRSSARPARSSSPATRDSGSAIADPDLLGAVGRASRRRLLRPAGDLRSADAHGRRAGARRLPATDSRRAGSIRSPSRCWRRCRADRQRARSRTCCRSKPNVNRHGSVHGARRSSRSAPTTALFGRFTRSTSTTRSRSAPASSMKRWCPGSAAT